MPTIEDTLEKAVADAIRMYARTCWKCAGKGIGPNQQDHDPEPVRLEDGRTAYAYPNAECEPCGGRGVLIPEATDPTVMYTGLCGVIGLAIRCREDANFDGMNRALDWGLQFTMRGAQKLGISVSESMALAQELLENSPIDDARPVVRVAPGAGLSQAELVALGALDD